MSPASRLSADSLLQRPEVAASFERLDHSARMMAAHWITQAVYVAAKLNIAQLLAGGSMSAPAIAESAAADCDAVARLLRALASLGVLRPDDGRYGLTETSRPLASGPDGPLHGEAIRAGEHLAQAWGDLLFSVRTGRSSFEEKFGMSIFDYLAANPMVGAMFDSAMSGFHGLDISDLVDAYDFAGCRAVADIGGGNAAMMIAVLQRHPRLQGIVFELPEVAERAAETVAKSPVAARCRTVAGDFTRGELPRADCLLLRHVIHNWPDDRAAEILAKCRASLVDGGRVVIAENVIPPDDRPHFGKLLDLAMLAIPGGRERTEREFAALLESAGLRLNRVVTTAGEMSAVEAVAAK